MALPGDRPPLRRSRSGRGGQCGWTITEVAALVVIGLLALLAGLRLLGVFG